MNKILSLFNKEINGLHQAAFLLAFASVGAKVLAILRDRLLASSFGAGKSLDIFYASFRLPDLLYVFSLFLVSITALIPVFLEKRDQKKDSHVFINGIFTVFVIFTIITIIILFLAIPYLVGVIAPGFSGEDTNTMINLSRILLLSPLFLGLSNIVSSVIQSYKRFFVYALSGVLYNAGIIVGILFFYPKFGINGLAVGVVLGAFFHFLIQVPTFIKLGYFPKFTLSVFKKEEWSDIVRILKLSFPRTLGLGLNQLVLVAITAFASFLAVGSIAVFNLASNLQSIPLGIIALSYSVAAFPSLAKNIIRHEKEKFLNSVVSSFRHILFWLIPITVLFIILRAQIVRVVLGAGAFTWADTRLTAAALALFTISLFAQGIILLLVRAFYAAGKTKLPVLINITSSLSIVCFSAGLLYIFKYFPVFQASFGDFLRVDSVAGASVLVLPLAYSLGSILNFLLLFYFFEREFGYISSYIRKSFLQISFVSIIMGFVAYLGLSAFSGYFNLETFWGIFAQGFLAGILSLIVGFFLFKGLKNKEFEELSSSLKKRFIKKYKPATKPEKPVKPEPEEMP